MKRIIPWTAIRNIHMDSGELYFYSHILLSEIWTICTGVFSAPIYQCKNFQNWQFQRKYHDLFWLMKHSWKNQYWWWMTTRYTLLSCNALLMYICFLSELYVSWADTGLAYSPFRSFLLFVLLVHHSHNAFVANAACFTEFILQS